LLHIIIVYAHFITLYCIKPHHPFSMQNNPKALIFVTDLHIVLAKQIKSLQKKIVNTFAQQKAQHYKAIKFLKKIIEKICQNPLSVTLLS